jgi:uncharacterized protein (DUF302 family)
METKQNSNGLNPWLTGGIGLVLGIVLTVFFVMWMAPGMMIQTSESVAGLEETVNRIEQAVQERGWTVQSVVNMNNSLQKHGHPFAPQVRVIKICQPVYAKSILESDRQMSVMMPCSLAVYETDDGRVMISQLNSSLMGSIFGGNVAEVMGGKVAPDVDSILEGLLK